MNLTIVKKATALLALLILFMLSTEAVSPAEKPLSPPLPNPVLVLKGLEAFSTGGKSFIRYNYFVENYAAYPNEMFAASPQLPPCGKNTSASRTWVDFYDQPGKRIYGFCALKDHDGLNEIWFALEEGVIPPSWVYIELTDRKTNIKYKSNLAETTP